ncbi:MAG: undecaprenyl-diphosphate phosphatase, partial [Bacteroidota bacterium]
SMIPAAFIGLLFEEQLEQLFNRQILLVGLMLIITGILLFLADRAQKTDQKVGFGQAMIIGIAQAIAILPGISRSGATISTSVLLGIDRERAARFSFLMVVPLILGKMAKDILSGEITYSSDFIVPLLAGFGAAFVTGLVACTWMIRLVKNSKLSYFSIYCFIVVAIAIGFGLF